MAGDQLVRGKDGKGWAFFPEHLREMMAQPRPSRSALSLRACAPCSQGQTEAGECQGLLSLP